MDKNEGQLDNPKSLHYPMNNLDRAFESFGWDVYNVDGTKYEPVLNALTAFKYGHRNGRPTLIICNCQKGEGGFSSFMFGHKVEFTDSLVEQEMRQQEIQRETRVEDLAALITSAENEDAAAIRAYAEAEGKKMGLEVSYNAGGKIGVEAAKRTLKTTSAPVRDKKLIYDPAKLPVLDPAKIYAPQELVTAAMKVFAADTRVVSVDSDLASTSGLEQGVTWVSRKRGLNAGVAEANMMNIAEGFAALGYNAWTSTFAPFFNWQVLRRIAISYQERIEAIEDRDGWLNAGHGLDITFLSTAPNLETRTNGATHMGNDDIMVYDGIAHLKIIDASCPRQVLSVMRWIMEGNRGLVYLRVMRTGGAVIYPEDYRFEFSKGTYLVNPEDAQAYIVSSGRGIYEALNAAKLLLEKGVKAGVVDMPSYDEELAEELHDSGRKIVIAEQNNGYLWHCFRKTLFSRKNLRAENIIPVNLLGKDGKPRFIHSATYEELLKTNSLSPEQIAERVVKVPGI
jgi:transketolase C-terminal domain/subunit